MEIKIEDLKVLYSEEQLQARIKELADEMNKFYNGEEVIAICVLKGAVMFATDLVKNLNMPLKMEFIRLSSYNGGTTTSGKKLDFYAFQATDLPQQPQEKLMLLISNFQI